MPASVPLGGNSQPEYASIPAKPFGAVGTDGMVTKFRFGAMTFVAESKEMAKDTYEAFQRIFVTPKIESSLSCPMSSCSYKAQTKADMVRHLAGNCEPIEFDAPETTYQSSFWVKTPVVTLLKETDVKDGYKLDLLDPTAVPYNYGIQHPYLNNYAKADGKYLATFTTKRYSITTVKTLWKFLVAQKTRLEKSKETPPHGHPVNSSLSFLKHEALEAALGFTD